MAVDSDRKIYFLILFIVIASLLFAKNLFRTEAGRAFIAIRDNDISAEVIGVDITMYKIRAFMLSSFYAGIAGGLVCDHPFLHRAGAFHLPHDYRVFWPWCWWEE